MNILRYIMDILSNIKWLFTRKYVVKSNPLWWSRILNESYNNNWEVYYPPHYIDDSTFIVAYMTTTWVQDCGPYFKIMRREPQYEYPSPNDRIIDLCRISMNEPKYIEGFDETFRLNKKQRERLMEVLQEPMSEYVTTTVWENIQEVMNNVKRLYHKDFQEIKIYDIPDYTLLPD